MLRFFTLFLFVLLGLFTLELSTVVQTRLIDPWTDLFVHLSAWLVKLFDHEVATTGNVLRDTATGFGVSIEPGCNGVEAVIILVAAIVAFPASAKARVVGILIGSLAIIGLNIIRIISLFYIGQWNIDVFSWAHLYIWPVLIILDALAVFILWTHYLSEINEKAVSQ